MFRKVVTFIDDFSSWSAGLENVEVYDFGREKLNYLYDDYAVSRLDNSVFFAGDIDFQENIYDLYGFAHESNWGQHKTTYLQTDFLQTDYFYQVDLYTDTYAELVTYPYDIVEGAGSHGDWVLDSFIKQLDNPNEVDIIAIDIDFLDFTDFDYLFNSTVAPPNYTSYFNFIFDDFYTNRAVSNASYINLGLSASISTPSLTKNQAAVISEILAGDAFVYQSTPNSTSSGINWSEYFPNVINVGAYNIDESGTPLFGEFSQLGTTDIFADGYVTSSFDEPGFRNWNFGTSFATPVVAAETLNWFDSNVLPFYNSGEYSIDDIVDLSDGELTTVIDSVIRQISTEVKLKFLGSEEIYTGRVLNDDLNDGASLPTKVPGEYGEMLPNIEMLWLGDNNAPSITGLTQNNFEINFDEEFHLDLGFTDLDYGDIVKFSAENLPEWMHFNENTGLLQGTPKIGDWVSGNIIITATDYFGSTDTEIISINFANQPQSTGRPITTKDFGNLAYNKGQIKFWVEYNDLSANGATTISVVTTKTKTITSPETGQRIAFEEPTIHWKGNASEASSFDFTDVSINVINITQIDINNTPMADTPVYGTHKVDLIIGNEFDNLIFAGDENDIIFGGGGDDKIYGEGGDDVLIGGMGDDELYGDYHKDTNIPEAEYDSKGSIINSKELDGDDIIIGGAGIDKIVSGEGQNMVASGNLSPIILNAELDSMHTFVNYDEDELPST